VSARTSVDIPTLVRNRALAQGAGAWLDALPALVAHLEADWRIEVGRSYHEGSEGFVCEATRADGTPAVLKLLADPGAARSEATVLRLANGVGCARLYLHDDARGALLIERLGRSLSRLGRPIGERHALLCDTVSRVWRPAPDCGLPTGAAKGRWLADFIPKTWDALGRPCAERAVDHALACAERRIGAHEDTRAVLVHGDVHEWNALEAGDGTFKLVDPDGYLAEPEYDLGILMREDPVDLMEGDPWDRARRLAARTGLDATAIWEWGAVERVSTGLTLLRIGVEDVGRAMLAVADRVAREPI
jgi:streptomycin 6-kinase